MILFGSISFAVKIFNVHRGYRTFPITWVLVVKLIEFIEINLMIEISFSTVLTGFFTLRTGQTGF